MCTLVHSTVGNGVPLAHGMRPGHLFLLGGTSFDGKSMSPRVDASYPYGIVQSVVQHSTAP